ncbi:MAG: hypothetical protein JNL11_01415 [Bdellovibrionaceae bacterium]|nr:hypothetical protein [Pseudobdellovibrionaceae bacterium]
MRFLFSFFLFTGFVSHSWSAACCGGGGSVPTIITSDDRAQFAVSYGATQVVIDHVDSQGYWRRWGQHQQTQTLKIEGAHIVADRWQWGVSLPVMTRNYSDMQYSGLGDIASTLSYEYLPDWDYNPYRPRGVGFVQLNLPTGKSRAESEIGGLDSLGSGYWSLGLGTMLVKSWRDWDAFTMLEWHQSFEKNINRVSLKGVARPGAGHNIGVGAGYNWSIYRAGINLNYVQEAAVRLYAPESESELQGMERWASLSASFGYMYSEEWAWSLIYTDQTLIGDPVNTSLGQGITLQLQKRWPR